MKILKTLGALLGAGALVLALGGTAAAEGNPPSAECAGFDFYFKIQAPENGAYDSSSPDVETNWPGQAITISNAADGNQEFDWASAQVVSQVVVKFGNDEVVLTGSLPGMSGSVDNNDQNAISHVTWCGDPTTTTTTSSFESSTTSSVESSTTSTV